MSRLVSNKSVDEGVKVAAEAEPGGESYAGRVAKYVPSEIVAGYAMLNAIVQSVSEGDPWQRPAAWVVFAVGLVATPLYLIKSGHPSGQQWVQVAISTIAFVIWVYTLGGPFTGTPSYRPWLGALLVGVYTFLAGLFQPRADPRLS